MEMTRNTVPDRPGRVDWQGDKAEGTGTEERHRGKTGGGNKVVGRADRREVRREGRRRGRERGREGKERVHP